MCYAQRLMSVVTQRLHLGQVFPAGTVREQTCLMPKQLITLGSFPREVTIGPISYQQRYLTMVKLGSNLCEKPDKEQGAGSSDDSFDNIPLITPLDVNQLQQPFPDKPLLSLAPDGHGVFSLHPTPYLQPTTARTMESELRPALANVGTRSSAPKSTPRHVIVKTRTEYQLQQKKKRKLHVPGIKKLNINLYDEVSEKVKLTGLILITVAFLACLLMLVMYKALWYDQLSCPEGFVFKHKHCTPAALEMYYSEQEVGPQGSLYTAINHLNQGKKTIPELPSPWLPVINALKEGEKGKEDPAGIQQ
ncbi:unnamed protein product [Caretta caretta]